MTTVPETLITATFKVSEGHALTVHHVPALLDEETGETCYSAGVLRAVDALKRQAQAHNLTEMQFDPSLIPPPRSIRQQGADPVAQELRRALRERGLTGAELASALGVQPPLVSRWLSPAYHGHSMETLRRIAEVLDMEVEVKFKPRAS